MSRTRRLLAFALELLILHIAVLGGMGCAACAAERSAPAQGAHRLDRAHHARAAHTAPHDGHPRLHGPAPLHQRDGARCVAYGCTVAAASPGTAIVVATITGEHTGIVVADEHLLRSARPAPEPPPPRL